MKRLFIVFFGLLTSFSFSQEVRTQKEILELPNTDLVLDFNLHIGNGNIVPITVSKATYKDIGFSFIGHKFQYMKDDYSLNIHTFKDKKLLQTKTTYNYGTFMKPQGFVFSYTYDANGNLSKRTSTSTSSTYTNETFYSYSSNKIKQVRETGTFTDGKKYDKTRNFIYKGTTISYNFENGTKDLELKNKLIHTEKTFNKSANKNYVYNFKYNTNGFMIAQDRGAYQATYTLNDKNLIAKEVNKTYTQTFKYVYDKYGNWIIAYPLATNNKKLYGSQFSYYIRQIKYSNGDVTGSINPDDTMTKTYIVKLRSELYDSLVVPNVTFRKTANSSYLFKINNQQEAKNTTSVFMGRSLLVFHKPSKQLYILEGFEDKKVGKYFPVKEVSIDLKNGFWYKTQKGGVHVFRKDGSYIKKVAVYEFAPNNIDAIFQGEGEPEKVVLENYKNVNIYTPYPVTLHSNYKNGSSGNMTKNAKKLAKSLDEYAEYYTGECVKGDCENGYGEKKFKDGKRADGFFKDGKPYGPAHTSDDNTKGSFLSVYKGSYQNREGFVYEFNGDNLMIFYDKSKDIGFYNDYKTKKTYVLNYKNGKVISKTELQYNNSKTCVVGNCSNGIGIYEYSNSTYMGTFRNGKREGFGYLFFKEGGTYIGEFYNNNYHGLGSYSRSEFDYYMGYYQNGKPHGQGVQYYSKDNYKAGNWVHGQLAGKGTSNSVSLSSNSTTNTTAKTSFSEAQKNKILACKNDSECVSRYLTSLYVEERKSLSGEALIKKTTDYFHSVYIMNPKLAYDTLFKMDISLIDLKMLPQAVQVDLRARAQKLSEAYQKHRKKQGY
ncbi:hypothetical protein [uncultured Kordia sp.]|uniref:hypothetical protein n=1 Tax=uncultured Kordia sp. TaxID=507699 RepID=UPI0026025646|nr:hypothetical protein [uncultured Kordia sp.]